MSWWHTVVIWVTAIIIYIITLKKELKEADERLKNCDNACEEVTKELEHLSEQIDEIDHMLLEAFEIIEPEFKQTGYITDLRLLDILVRRREKGCSYKWRILKSEKD